MESNRTDEIQVNYLIFIRDSTDKAVKQILELINHKIF